MVRKEKSEAYVTKATEEVEQKFPARRRRPRRQFVDGLLGQPGINLARWVQSGKAPSAALLLNKSGKKAQPLTCNPFLDKALDLSEDVPERAGP